MEKHNFGAYARTHRSVWQELVIDQEPKGKVHKPVVFWIKPPFGNTVELDVVCVYDFQWSDEVKGYKIACSFILPPDDISEFEDYLPLIAEGFLKESAKEFNLIQQNYELAKKDYEDL
jgi:hypothetical protein